MDDFPDIHDNTIGRLAAKLMDSLDSVPNENEEVKLDHVVIAVAYAVKEGAEIKRCGTRYVTNDYQDAPLVGLLTEVLNHKLTKMHGGTA
jgi:hypothetical protein